MIYVGCSCCRQILLLCCTGQFMPHAPLPAINYGGVACCQICGQMQPLFTCSNCWTRQMTMMMGAQIQYSLPYLTQMINSGMQIAPMLPSNSSRMSSNMFGSACSKFIDGMMQNLGGHAGDAVSNVIGDMMGGW
jgi:hypothetical protein